MIEYTGPRAIDYQNHFAQHLLHFITSPQPEVRQAAAYGAGVMGQFGGPAFASLCASAMPGLIQVQAKLAFLNRLVVADFGN